MDGSVAEAPRPWYVTQQFDDADDFARAVQGSGIEYVPLQPGPYRTRLTVLSLGGITVQRAADRAHVTRGVVDPGIIGVLMPVSYAAPPIVNGMGLGDGDALLLDGGAEIHALCPAEVEWASIAMTADLAQEFEELGRLRGAHGQAGATCWLPPAVARPVRDAILTMTDLMIDMPHQAATLGMAQVMAGSLTELLHTAFAAAEDTVVPRAMRQALRLVGDAEAVLRADPARIVFTTDLCAVLGVSPRTLHKAFVAGTGTSPQDYLRRWRLMQVHAALKSGGGDAGLVKSVALAHGFWHLGHFARAYRRQFGQAPSETLAGARPGRYRRAVAIGG